MQNVIINVKVKGQGHLFRARPTCYGVVNTSSRVIAMERLDCSRINALGLFKDLRSLTVLLTAVFLCSSYT